MTFFSTSTNDIPLTGTATLKMHKDISRLLGMTDMEVVRGSVGRPNVKYTVNRRHAQYGAHKAVENSYTGVCLPLLEELCIQ